MSEIIETDGDAETVDVESSPPPFPDALGGAFGPDMGHTRWDTRTEPLRAWRRRLGLKQSGPYTRRDRDAALRIQRSAGLEQTGTVDRLTWEAAWA